MAASVLHLLFLDIEILLLTRQKKYWRVSSNSFFAILDHFEEKGTLVHYLRKSILVYLLSSAKGHFHIKDDADTWLTQFFTQVSNFVLGQTFKLEKATFVFDYFFITPFSSLFTQFRFGRLIA